MQRITRSIQYFQNDEDQDGLGDFLGDDDDMNSDDDNNLAPQNFKAIASKEHQGKGLKMRRMNYET